MNQAATPGLGSFIGGRRVAGCGQLLFSVAGFILVIIWFVRLMIGMYQQIDGVHQVDIPAIHRWGKAGVIIFLVGWLWSWISSIQLLLEARRNEMDAPASPPRNDS